MSEQKFFRREEIIGKTVINTSAEKIGEVKDIGYDTNGRTALIVISQDGKEEFYPMDETVAIRDVVILDEKKQRTADPRPAGVPFASMENATTAPIPVPLTKACHWCNRVNHAENKFCSHCGKPLQ